MIQESRPKNAFGIPISQQIMSRIAFLGERLSRVISLMDMFIAC
jgi:hypothetical protein